MFLCSSSLSGPALVSVSVSSSVDPKTPQNGSLVDPADCSLESCQSHDTKDSFRNAWIKELYHLSSCSCSVKVLLFIFFFFFFLMLLLLLLLLLFLSSRSSCVMLLVSSSILFGCRRLWELFLLLLSCCCRFFCCCHHDNDDDDNEDGGDQYRVLVAIIFQLKYT